MVDVKEQKIFEIDIPERKLLSNLCPHVFYPINIHGCNHQENRIDGDYKECSPDICPFYKSKEVSSH